MTPEEVRRLIREETRFRTGLGFDVHRFAPDRRLVLAGVEIPHEVGLLGHSDADVITHAVMDAVLGAMGESDIGVHFPDTDPAYKNADSLKLAEHVGKLLSQRGLEVVSLDVMVMAEAPKLAPHRQQMKENLARAFGMPPEQVALKATTMEKMGFVGRREGIAAMASALLRQI
jgi:2-C-methyl-D-erythritol 2,4-cyclodiphosphate synthase